MVEEQPLPQLPKQPLPNLANLNYDLDSLEALIFKNNQRLRGLIEALIGEEFVPPEPNEEGGNLYSDDSLVGLSLNKVDQISAQNYTIGQHIDVLEKMANVPANSKSS